MADVREKPLTHRRAVAGARVLVRWETLDLICSGGTKKGDVLTAAHFVGNGGGCARAEE